MKIGAFLKGKRQNKGLTVRTLAEKAGVSFSYVAQLERELCKPTLDVIHRLLAALNIDWVEFLLATGYMRNKRRRAKALPYIKQKKAQTRRRKVTASRKKP